MSDKNTKPGGSGHPFSTCAPSHTSGGCHIPVIASDLASLPAAILERLAAEGIHSADDWRQLSRRKRRSIFGITAEMVRRIDALTVVRK